MRRRWTISVSRKALGALYTLPRGIAGNVTDAIDALLTDPIPAHSVPVEAVENMYRIDAHGYTIEYEVIDAQGIIKILSIR